MNHESPARTVVKATAILVSFVVVAWVIAEAMDVEVFAKSTRLPTIRELVDAGPEASGLLRGTPAGSDAAADLLAHCLLQAQPSLRQVARSVANERLDQWELGSATKHQRLVTRLSGSLRRVLERPHTELRLTAEASEIAARLMKTANRRSFLDGASCTNDCQVVLAFERGPSMIEVHPRRNRIMDPVHDELKRAVIAPVTYQAPE